MKNKRLEAYLVIGGITIASTGIACGIKELVDIKMPYKQLISIVMTSTLPPAGFFIPRYYSRKHPELNEEDEKQRGE